MNNLSMLLKQNAYPGRGIVVGRSADAAYAVMAYFIMGRSENSRNRIFVAEEGGLRTRAFDPAKMQDPSLVIYWPVRVQGDYTILTNGDQTDTIDTFMRCGESFEQALATRTFEPDAPNFTPRISALLQGFDYKLSILKSQAGNPNVTQRFFFDYCGQCAGCGHFLHTYSGDGNPLPSFSGEPEPVGIEGNLDAFTAQIWDNLDKENRVSLFTRFIHVESGRFDSRIVNQNK